MCESQGGEVGGALKSRPPTSLRTESTLLCRLRELPLLARLGWGDWLPWRVWEIRC